MAKSTNSANNDHPLSETLGELAREVATLVHQEVSLAKREVGEKLALAGRDAGLIVAGGAGAYGGFLTLLAALTLRLAGAESRWSRAALLTGLLTLGAGGALIAKGLNGLREADMVPRQTLQTLEEDEQWLKERTPHQAA